MVMTDRQRWHGALLGGALVAGVLTATSASAQTPAEVADLRAQLAALKAEQAAAARRIALLEAALDARAGHPAVAATGSQADSAVTVAPPANAAPTGVAVAGTVPQAPTAPVNPAGGSGPGTTPTPVAARVALSGDLRLRYENNSGDQDAIDRGRLVMRGRLRASYPVNRWLTIGGELATGDPGDPNSTDITLTGFDNDLAVSLDQAYLRGTFGNLTANGGKFAQPFVRTELVWDGDVPIQGVAASYRANLGRASSLRAHGLYMIVDEAAGGPDSYMLGGQLQFESTQGAIKFELAAGYYDYTLGSVAGADAGDTRTNRFVGGRYLSDFDLLDVVGGVTYTGLGARWPIRVVGDYVHNFGATTTEDTGFGVDLLFGRGSQHRDWRFGYGYAQTGVDAVFAAFSHDNTDLATNYLQHSLFAEYVVVPRVVLNATVYHYRPKSAAFTPAFLPNDWLNRVRLNMLVNF